MVCVCVCVCVCVFSGQPLDKWLSNKDSDLRDRLLILQQVVTTLATLHTLGHKDSLALWGSFMGECFPPSLPPSSLPPSLPPSSLPPSLPPLFRTY